ncbi:MAG: DUF2092 domain-containing protein [Ignavibacteria bacterium]|nr:DUF2092 domain-containing protein [Ignavibacteria bacterium]
MFKKIIFTAFLLLTLSFSAIPGKSYSQIDTLAVAILDSMSNNIGELETCSFRFALDYDIFSENYGMITHSDAGTIFLKGPDKILMERQGDKGHKKFFYNGKTCSLYSFDRNNYATIPAPPTIIETIDSISNAYGVEFPAADVFYPDFVDDLLDVSDRMIYLGLTMTGIIECYHVAGVTDDFTYQLWIMTEKDNYTPVKLSIVYDKKPGKPRYSALYYDWKLNPELDDAMFEFSPPAGSEEITILKKN